jgi:hypothetical protein
MRRLTFVLLLTLTAACGSHTPPNLSPAARAAYGNTRVLKVLDLIRDTAIDGSTKVPPVFSERATVAVVRAHRSIITVIDASRDGWQGAVKQSLDELLKDRALLPAEVQLIAPYVPLVKSLIDELAPRSARAWVLSGAYADTQWLLSHRRGAR